MCVCVRACVCVCMHICVYNVLMIVQNIKKNIKKYHHQFDAQDRLGREKASQVSTNVAMTNLSGYFYVYIVVENYY